jgi:hypothetical protein
MNNSFRQYKLAKVNIRYAISFLWLKNTAISGIERELYIQTQNIIMNRINKNSTMGIVGVTLLRKFMFFLHQNLKFAFSFVKKYIDEKCSRRKNLNFLFIKIIIIIIS